MQEEHVQHDTCTTSCRSRTKSCNFQYFAAVCTGFTARTSMKLPHLMLALEMHGGRKKRRTPSNNSAYIARVNLMGAQVAHSRVSNYVQRHSSHREHFVRPWHHGNTLPSRQPVTASKPPCKTHCPNPPHTAPPGPQPYRRDQHSPAFSVPQPRLHQHAPCLDVRHNRLSLCRQPGLDVGAKGDWFVVMAVHEQSSREPCPHRTDDSCLNTGIPAAEVYAGLPPQNLQPSASHSHPCVSRYGWP